MHKTKATTRRRNKHSLSDTQNSRDTYTQIWRKTHTHKHTYAQIRSNAMEHWMQFTVHLRMCIWKANNSMMGEGQWPLVFCACFILLLFVRVHRVCFIYIYIYIQTYRYFFLLFLPLLLLIFLPIILSSSL